MTKNVAAKLMLLEYYKPELYDKVVDPKNKEDFDEIESNKVKDKNVFKADLNLQHGSPNGLKFHSSYPTSTLEIIIIFFS